ncbi:hypothetical protein PFISCL1PPCAC_4591 [Pristionchus fissidentatus]|uniref:FAD dependent oxidoreductase domain-containing protein n=1 Tax=Pristionchus fissidentatus TaxID=1538716 RepID=A0AAV5V1P5_9BILA|nr:hypothetical protein PFISCL1PPCAC_4591 [Pristionchus fissidentatus]
MPPTPRIVVVGAGVIGLSTAVELQQVLPGTEIQIVAARFSPDLTSDVAAGIWRPYISRFTVPELENQVLSSAFIRFTALARNQECGIIRQSGYDVTRNVDAPPPPFMAFVRGLRELSREEIDEFGKEYKKGWFYTTYGIQTTVFIRYLTKEFLANGGKFVQRELKSLEELNEDFDIIINCCGLGSRRLLGEEKLYPIRGQVVRVRAPAVKHFFMDDDDYILLNRDFVVLGATHDKGSWDLSVNEETTRSIMERNEKIFPELKYAEILSVHVGLRPFREEIRLEKEIKMTEKGRKVVLIHNYGHGGSGVTLSLGCAEQVGKMVAEAMMGSKL